jgi:predicted AlkP superfamily phosphohydrolase/phosphomutase
MQRIGYFTAGGILAACSLSWIAGCADSAGAASEDPAEMKMLVLGMDGLDPVLLKKLMDEGKLPNFSSVAAKGTFNPLETSMPPQSPVAWSNFISGARPDTHMIWDFIHRDPAPAEGGLPIRPFQSTGDVGMMELPWYKDMMPKHLPWFGHTQLPVMTTTEIKSSRQGPAFWDQLVAGGVDTTIYRVPANYPPPVEVKGHGRFRCLCGMGTPDATGSYGEFMSFRTDVPADKKVPGGRVRRLVLEHNRVESHLVGPPNDFKHAEDGHAPPDMLCPITFTVDPEDKTVKIGGGDPTVIVKEGGWSEWVQIRLDTEVPLLDGMFAPLATVRFKVIEAGEDKLNVYATPLQIDPIKPVTVISTPPEWAAEIAEKSGRYYTAGIPEDTKALRSDPQALTEDQFLAMVENLAAERRAQYKVALSEFKRGFLFFYFGHTDQLAHVFWRDIDPGHPGRIPEQEGKYDKVIENAYLEMDVRLGEALAVLDDNDVLIVMSDHGFASFRRGFNVNTWLQRNGYEQWYGTRAADRNAGLLNIDFAQSRAYAIGINSLFVNLRGREAQGIVAPEDYHTVLHEIGDKLLAFRDDDGTQVIERIYYVREEFPDLTDEKMRFAPDMLIGYASNYRGSWATALGGMRGKIVEDNLERWSGDHCIAHHLVPGSLLSNLKITVDDPSLSDLAPSLLKLWKLGPHEDMIGRDIFARPERRVE